MRGHNVALPHERGIYASYRIIANKQRKKEEDFLKRVANNTKRTIAVSAILLAIALMLLSSAFALTHAKYVTEIGDSDNTLDYETQTPFNVGSQQELYNAIKSGYGYVKLSEDLKGPIIMTGDALDLKNDLTIDLNGNEIERNNRSSLLNVPAGKTFTVIDTKGGGGLYNPIGSVLTVSGGDLNVYGGMFESGPRPTEYYTTLKTESEYVQLGTVTLVDTNGIATSATAEMPRLAVRSASSKAPHSGNIYFDVPFASGSTEYIKRDTYCYVVVSGETDDDFATFDVSAASFAYTYYVDGNGVPCESTQSDARQAMLFGYENDIYYSSERTENGKTIPAPNYAAVSMMSGNLNINVTDAGEGALTKSRTAGSFYSYFGTWHTSCFYITGGTMRVSTSGELATVNPAELPAVLAGETRTNSAKYGESACILSTGGTLDIRKLQSATSYNGSVISLSDGEVIMRDANINKYATISHADSPFDVMEIPSTDPNTSTATEFPAGRQYRDAAIFLNGGTLTLTGSDTGTRNKSVNVTVHKNIAAGKAHYAANLGEITGADGEVFQTTFGILSRGRSGSQVRSSMIADNIAIDMEGAHSFGVFGTRGDITLSDGSITLDSDSYTYGIYAVNKTEAAGRAVRITLNNTSIYLGVEHTYEGETPANSEWIDASGNAVSAGSAGAMRAASIGVALDSSEFKGGAVVMNNSHVYSQEMGVAVNGGSLTFGNGGSIAAYNASAISLSGGTIGFDDNEETAATEEYTIDCVINRKGTGVTNSCSANAAQATAAGTHQYDMYLPWQSEVAGQTVTRYENENGICVVGGSLTATGKLNIRFRGLYNNYNQYSAIGTGGTYYNHDKLVVKSFAVACIESEPGKDEEEGANIFIKHANITSQVGGGVKVQGGTVTLGDENTTREEISVQTTGAVHYNTAYYAWSGEAGNAWQFYPSLSGGYAVVARSGNIHIYNGEYTAMFGDGVAATSDANRKTVVHIYNGKFTGNLTHTPPSDNEMQSSGPACFYGLKVFGESDIRIYNGEFDGKNGGAIVRGVDSGHRANVWIYAGIFGARVETENSEVGQDGFNVYDYSTVYFGAYTDEELNAHGYDTLQKRQSAIQVRATLFPIAANPLVPIVDWRYDTDIKIYVYYGRYFIRRPYTTRKSLSIGSVLAGMKNTDFFIYGYGTNVFAQNRGNDWEVTRIRWNSTTSVPSTHNSHLATTKNQVYYSAIDEPTTNLVTREHVPNSF